MKVLLTEKEIQERLKFLAYEISKNYDEVTFLVALTGGMYTAVDLSKYMTIPVKFEFVKISSYGDEETSSIIELKWMSAIKGTDLGNVIIIDDICDTGKTLDYLLKYMKNNYKYNSVESLTLLDKPSRRIKFLEPNYIGFKIENKFVIGYGLDDKQYDRNLVNICYKEEGEKV